MGNLIKVLTRDIDNNAGNFFLDFENAQPTEAERAVWEQVNEVLMEALAILDDLQSYNGAGEEIRQAIQNPSEDRVQERAWAAVVPLVGKLKKFYEFSLRGVIAWSAEGSDERSLQSHPASGAGAGIG
ncbi:unnamed protein product [Coregonus sp. 'balchen']|nr:unnamed protein product [Coregonus sp. 'balchen']